MGKLRQYLDEIKQLYLSGLSVRRIAIQFNCDKSSIVRRLVRMGISVRQQVNHDINHSYFTKIDTPEKAYWLGFLSADGCITVNYNKSGGTTSKVKLKLQAKDISHLEKWAKTISTNLQIKYQIVASTVGGKKQFAQVRVEFGSKQMVHDLISLGITPNKTRHLVPPILESHLKVHYWRGFIDGDGWIMVGKNKVIGLVGVKNVIDAYVQFLRDHDINRVYVKRHHHTRFLYIAEIYNKDDLSKLAQLLYNDKPSLNRKSFRANLLK